jgi:hypothetical protein
MTSTEPTQAAQKRALTVAACTAIVPTLLAAQGMILVGTGILHLPAAFAVVLAGFLELALISSALLARAAAMDGRPSGADSGAVWVFSAVSGAFSATHELIGSSGWQFGPTNLLAASVRIAAPLVAAWLWERVLVSARLDAAARTATEIRRDRRLLAFARAVQRLERLEASGIASARQVHRALGRADTRHVALLRHAPATDVAIRADIQTWLAAFGCTGARYLEWAALPSRPTLASTERPAAPDSPRATPAAAPSPILVPVPVQSADLPVRSPRKSARRPLTSARASADRGKAAMHARFSELVAQDPSARPRAVDLHAELGASCDPATSRRWVAQWVAQVEADQSEDAREPLFLTRV